MTDIERLKATKDFLKEQYNEDLKNCKHLELKPLIIETYHENIKAFNVAISALEKQIPKKATEETINRGIDISGEYDIDFDLCCPNCSAVVGTFEAEENEYYFKYCPTCGQALDWGDSE